MESRWVHELPGYESIKPGYKIYTDGTIESYICLKSNGETFYSYIADTPQKELRPYNDGKGYFKVALSTQEGTRLSRRVHRLVALAFIPNPENKPQVNHVDADKSKNRVDNLEWATNQENHDHKMAHGLNVSLSGEEHYMHKSSKYKDWHHARKTVRQYDKQGNYIAEYSSLKEAAKTIGVDPSTISKACDQPGKTSGGYIWRKKNP